MITDHWRSDLRCARPAIHRNLRGLPTLYRRAILSRMGTNSRETIYGASVRAAAERAAEARREADRLACEAWDKRMLSFQGSAQPSRTLGDALNAGDRPERRPLA